MEWLLTVGKDKNDPERKREVEERTLTREFTVYNATITFPNGDTENVSYTKADYGDGVLKIFDHDADDYGAYRQIGYSNNCLRLNINYDKPRRFSMSNIRDINVTDEREMIAVAEVNAEVQYKRESEHDEWEETGNVYLASGSDDPDVTVWPKEEWEEFGE